MGLYEALAADSFTDGTGPDTSIVCPTVSNADDDAIIIDVTQSANISKRGYAIA